MREFVRWNSVGFCSKWAGMVLVALWIPLTAHANSRVVINELHYHPADDSLEGEFIEIFNFGDTGVDLTGWRLEGGVEYTFPAVNIPAGGYLVVAGDAGTVRSRYGLDSSVVIGTFTDNLSNNSEEVRLVNFEDYLISFVFYDDEAPWPETADGLGPSLERIHPLWEEDDAAMWEASFVVGGTPGAQNSAQAPIAVEPPPQSDVELQRWIRPGATWRFFRGIEAPPQDWTERTFDDSNWNEGPAGFGYGDEDDATEFPGMEGNFLTVFVRRSFQVQDPSRVDGLTLLMDFDDGFVAYINGVEVARDNVFDEAWDEPAFGTHEAGQAVHYQLVVDGLLRPGNNVLAVQGHNAQVNSSDFSLHPALEAQVRLDVDPSDNVRDVILPGATWSFFRGTDAPPADWNQFGFDATSWEEGTAGFGYGDFDDATELPEMENGYLTVFLRREFTIDDPAEVEEARLRVDYDDGFVAYVNGEEVARRNVTDSGFDDPAVDTHEAGVFEEFPVPPALLRAGANVLAVQGHNTSVGSSDFSLHPALRIRVAGEDDEPPPPPQQPPTRPARDLVINEVAPGNGGTGWVELYNPTGTAVAAGGRRLIRFPSRLGDYVLPAGTVVEPGGTHLVAESELGFQLDAIPALILTTPDDQFIDGFNPRTVVTSESTGRFPDGDDNRYVFTTATPGSKNAPNLNDSIVINEIMYHPGPKNTGDEYVELVNVSQTAVDLEGWAFTRGIDYRFAAGVTLGPGEFLVLAKDPVALEAYYGITGVLGPYTGSLANDAETLLLRDANENQADRVRFADEGSYPEEPDGLGPALELIHPGLENRYGPAWAASLEEGTPGAPNSVVTEEPAPIVVDVSHTPVIPGPEDDVRVLALVSDNETIVSATLYYEIDRGNGSATQVTLRDDGLQDDGVAGNGVYGADIPAQPDGSIVAFWFEVQESGPELRTVIVPEAAPTPAFLYQVLDSPAPGLRPYYRLVMRGDDLRELQTRSAGSNELLDATLIADGRAYYNRGVRYRGSSARSCEPKSYRIQFDHDVSFHGIKRLNLNGCSTHRQWLGLDFLRRTGIPTPQCWFRLLTLNNRTHSGIHLRVEAIHNLFLERTMPDDADGNLYRGEGRANLDYRGEEVEQYTSNYTKVTNELTNDYSDVLDLCFRFDAETTSDEDFPPLLEERIDVNQWAKYFAAFAILGSTENSILLNNGDDYFLYHRFSDDRWVLLPWDLDSCFDEFDQVLFRPTVESIVRFLQHPNYAPDYWCHLEWLMDAAFRVDLVDTRLEHLQPLFSDSQMAEVRDYAPQRWDYIEPRLSPELTVGVETGGGFCNDRLEVHSSPVVLSGRAPGCGTTDVLINGLRANYDPTSASWTAAVDVTPGGEVEIRSRYRTGVQIARLTVPVAEGGGEFTSVPLQVDADLTLTAAESPYRVRNNTTIGAGATVTINPGVTLAFDFDATLRVSGTLIAAGTAQDPVVFQSDDCGDVWEGIHFLPGSAGHRLTHCRLEGLSAAQGLNAGVVVNDCDLTIEESTIVANSDLALLVTNGGRLTATALRVGSQQDGILFAGGQGTLTDCLVDGLSGRAVEASGAAIGVVAISGGKFSNCGNGLLADGQNVTVSGLSCEDISGTALSFSGSGVARVETCLIWQSGTALYAADGAQVAMDHCTIYGCDAGLVFEERTGGAGGSGGVLDSLIVWATLAPVIVDGNSSLLLTFSTTSGALQPGEGNIHVDPVLWSPAAGDFRLRPSSPCRGTGKAGTDMGAVPYVDTGDEHRFTLCDMNGDGGTDISDAVFGLLFLFGGGADSECRAARDCNSDGQFDVSDAIFSLNHMFAGGPSPAAPYPNCDSAPVADCAVETCVE